MDSRLAMFVGRVAPVTVAVASMVNLGVSATNAAMSCFPLATLQGLPHLQVAVWWQLAERQVAWALSRLSVVMPRLRTGKVPPHPPS